MLVCLDQRTGAGCGAVNQDGAQFCKVSFMFKLTFAALPAVFAATIVWMIFLGFLSALFGGSLLPLLLR